MKVKRYEELVVWQKAMHLAKRVYCVQKQLPKEEIYGLGDQIRRAVVSIPSNIAEGFGRDTDKEFRHFRQSRVDLSLKRKHNYNLRRALVI